MWRPSGGIRATSRDEVERLGWCSRASAEQFSVAVCSSLVSGMSKVDTTQSDRAIGDADTTPASDSESSTADSSVGDVVNDDDDLDAELGKGSFVGRYQIVQPIVRPTLPESGPEDLTLTALGSARPA